MSYTSRGQRPSNRGYASPRKSYSRRPSFQGAYIDVAKFINKTVASDKVEVYIPENLFSDFKLEDLVKKNIEEKGYIAPTPIQDRTIPLIIEGKDVVGIANTGTGKTAAFLIPLINKIIQNPREKVLVMVPTRELAQQIDDRQEF